MAAAGDAYTAIYRIGMECRIISVLHQGTSVPGMYTPADIPQFVEFLDTSILKFERSHQAVYLGVGTTRRCV